MLVWRVQVQSDASEKVLGPLGYRQGAMLELELLWLTR